MKDRIELYEDVLFSNNNEIMTMVRNLNEISLALDNVKRFGLENESYSLHNIYLASVNRLNKTIETKFREAEKLDQYSENVKNLGFNENDQIDPDMAAFLGDLAGFRDDQEDEELNISIR